MLTTRQETTRSHEPIESDRVPVDRVNIRPYSDDMRAAWDAYVLGQPDGTLFHLIAWKRAIEREFGFESRYLLAENNGQIHGVLPLFFSSNWVQGRTLISTPFAVYGGICSDNATASLALREAACRTATEESVNYLELREPHRALGEGFLTKELYVTFEQQLPRDPEQLLRTFPKDTRYMIRKGQKSGLRSVDAGAQLDTFYEIYAQSVRNLGTPVFSKSFFQILLDEFGEAAEILTVWNASKAIAAVLSFRFRDAILPYYGGSLLEGRRFAANNFMYWEVFRNACERGFKTFDFGRSKVGTGSYFFKTQWNMRERPLPYQFYLVRRTSLPNFSPANPKLKFAIELWKRIPFPLTKAWGPALVRLFP
jgi:FemAB-related protein (PEP-CTERM system-associated)